MVVLDGGRGAYYAIKQTWPTTRIQRCLVHAQRVVRRHLTSRPRTDAGKALYKLALDLTRITTIDQAAQWSAQLQEFDTVYRTWMDEKHSASQPASGNTHIYPCARPITA